MQDSLLVIDGLQYANWSEDIFLQMREGGVSAVHATICYHENFRETVAKLSGIGGSSTSPVSFSRAERLMTSARRGRRVAPRSF
jgi:hypothetical protein